ncbi:MAG: hypothetical protein JWO97_4751 [Acidobacteria bacterium]|nr:hypothetical protein [Acidobacteriota bacterium]
MNGCDREELVLDMARAGRNDAELTAHIAVCDSCADVALVAGAVAADHVDALRNAPVPPSGLVWWRMQRRAADDAARDARRAVIAAQTLSFVAAIAIVVALLTTIGGVSIRALRDAVHLPTLVQWSLPLGLGLAVCVALAPVAIYFAVARD